MYIHLRMTYFLMMGLKNEIKFPSTFRHPNLVRLLGYCTENKERFLVYEHMENGSLHNALFGRCENLRKRLNWHTKMRICLGIANGLAFLHHKDESKAMIVHRNITLSNIFLDKFLNPKISYFCLAKHFEADETHCNSVVGGINNTGYIAPEYLATGSMTEKIDVYSFGVSILVLSTEKRVHDPYRFETASLVDLAKGLHQKGDILSLIDEDLKSSNSVKEAASLVDLDTHNQKGVQSKLEFFEPSFEEGKLHIEFSDEEFRAVYDEWENSLVGFFVGEDVPFNMDLKMIEKLWEVKGDFSVFTTENRYFIFQFSCVEEKMRVLESANLWRIRQRQLILKEWDSKLMLERTDMESLPIWVKIYNLPLFFWTPSVLSKVGSGLGTPLYADQKTQNRQELAYAMLCIEFDAYKPLPESLRILVKGMEYHLSLEYYWKPLRCEHCCTFGHIKLDCRAKMKAKKQN
ncbi:hypothetical protein MKX01_010512 [Papaver californicum]|nr:hypothetical protein MKX01_010512 [Papaver californicum]